MSLLVRTIPFALVAAFFPAGLVAVVWLLALPQGRVKALVYFAGAATCTIGSGGAIVTLIGETGATPEQHPAAVAGVRVAVGLILLIFGVFVVGRRAPGRSEAHAWPAGRRNLHYGWIFILGVVMWTPSFAYLVALGFIADAELSAAARWAQLLLIDGIILLMVEVPLIVHALAPQWAAKKLRRISALVTSRARPIGLVSAGGGGLYLIVTGIHDLI